MTFRDFILDQVKEGDVQLNLRERLKLRVVLRLRPEVLENELFAHAQAEGLVPVSASISDDAAGGSIDWEALAKFIKEVLPAILQIIQLFL